MRSAKGGCKTQHHKTSSLNNKPLPCFLSSTPGQAFSSQQFETNYKFYGTLKFITTFITAQHLSPKDRPSHRTRLGSIGTDVFQMVCFVSPPKPCTLLFLNLHNIMQVQILWIIWFFLDATLCTLVDTYQCIAGSCHLHHQSIKTQHCAETNTVTVPILPHLHIAISRSLNTATKFLWKLWTHVPDHTAMRPYSFRSPPKEPHESYNFCKVSLTYHTILSGFLTQHLWM